MLEPIIELRIDHMRDKLIHGVMMYENEYKDTVIKCVEKALSADNLEERIQEQVNLLVDDTIKSIRSDATLKEVMLGIIEDAIRDKYNK